MRAGFAGADDWDGTATVGEGERPRAGGWGSAGEGERPRAGGWGSAGEGERPRAGGWGWLAVPLVLALLVAVSTVPGTASASAGRERVVVTFAEGVTAADRAAVLAERGTADGDADAATLSLPAGAPAVVHATPAERAALAADHRVDSVDVDIPVEADQVIPKDPAWPEQHGVRRVRIDELWPRTTGDRDVVIAVIDSGVDPANRDLEGRLLAGYDFVNGDRDARDDYGHGTAVATIAAAAGDTFGIAGACWRCRVLPVKVLDAGGKGFLSDAALGITWAVERGADILNVSLGAGGSMPSLDRALAKAERAGALVIASAGNAGTTVKQWPAADPRVLAVGALGARGRRAPYSSHGGWVDLAAPGCNPAGWLDNVVTRFCGTSSSAPLVSGTAALVASERDSSGSRIRAALRTSAVAAGAGLGAGRVDALAAFSAVPRFADVVGTVHQANIEALAAAGITRGCTRDRYCPARKVTRGQLATFLDRALELPDGSATFADVPVDHPHHAGIAAIAAAGITTGCDAQRFCPAAHVTRGQMAGMLRHALALDDGPALSPVRRSRSTARFVGPGPTKILVRRSRSTARFVGPGPTKFTDVASGHAHAEGIRAIAAAGITTGCAPDRFCPGATVDRAQMASFLGRALDL